MPSSFGGKPNPIANSTGRLAGKDGTRPFAKAVARQRAINAARTPEELRKAFSLPPSAYSDREIEGVCEAIYGANWRIMRKVSATLYPITREAAIRVLEWFNAKELL